MGKGDLLINGLRSLFQHDQASRQLPAANRYCGKRRMEKVFRESSKINKILFK